MSTRMSMDQLRQFAPNHPDVVASDKRHREAIGKATEDKLQTECETWLKHRGYWPRTPAMIEAGPPPMGWYIHYPGKAAKRCPLILDLLILGNDGRYLEIELKTATGKLKKHQRQLVDHSRGIGPVRTLDELRVTIEQHESEG